MFSNGLTIGAFVQSTWDKRIGGKVIGFGVLQENDGSIQGVVIVLTPEPVLTEKGSVSFRCIRTAVLRVNNLELVEQA